MHQDPTATFFKTVCKRNRTLLNIIHGKAELGGGVSSTPGAPRPRWAPLLNVLNYQPRSGIKFLTGSWPRSENKSRTWNRLYKMWGWGEREYNYKHKAGTRLEQSAWNLWSERPEEPKKHRWARGQRQTKINTKYPNRRTFANKTTYIHTRSTNKQTVNKQTNEQTNKQHAHPYTHACSYLRIVNTIRTKSNAILL